MAKSAVAKATSHLELMQKLADQARTVADEATCSQAALHEALVAACHAQKTAINNVDVTTANEAQCVAELNATDMDTLAAAKNQLALGAKTLLSSATLAYDEAVNVLKSLHERMKNVNTPDKDGSPIRPQGMAMTPHSTLTNSTTPASARTMVTPGSIVPGNEFRQAFLLLHAETTTSIQNIKPLLLAMALNLTPPILPRR